MFTAILIEPDGHTIRRQEVFRAATAQAARELAEHHWTANGELEAGCTVAVSPLQ